MDRKEQDNQDQAIRELVPLFQNLGYSRDYAVYIVLALDHAATSLEYESLYGTRGKQAINHILNR
jgi:hypothetical protein